MGHGFHSHASTTLELRDRRHLEWQRLGSLADLKLGCDELNGEVLNDLSDFVEESGSYMKINTHTHTNRQIDR